MTKPRTSPASSDPEGAARELSRRELLRLAALGAAAVALEGVLGGCKSETFLPPAAGTLTPALPKGSETPAPTPIVELTPSPGVTPETTTVPSATPTAAGPPDLVVVKKGEPEVLVRRAIAALGGMERFVPKGANVIVKPNICTDYRTYQYAATTNPWVVGTLVKLAFEAGAAVVKVMDYPYGGAAASAYTRSGIQQQVQAAGGEMVVMSSRKFVSTRIPQGKWLKKTEVYDDILKADVLINVPILKSHGSARVTAAMKNLMGIVRDRPSMHGSLHQAIADLASLVRPQLTVLDAVRVLTAHGPSGGNLRDVLKLDTVAASPDIVAIDAYAAQVFGLKPNDLAYVRIGAAMGLGQSDLSKLRLEQLTV
jgi:uncharacterized protein (DUF362 family)